MIPKVNLGVGEIEFLFCDLLVSPRRENIFNKFPCLTSVLPGDTSDSRNSLYHKER